MTSSNERCTPEKTGFAAEVEKKISEHAGSSSVEQPEPIYFYATDYPHRWTSGPSLSTLDDERQYMPIESLERARELAEARAVKSYGEDRCDTSYGVMYRAVPQ